MKSIAIIAAVFTACCVTQASQTWRYTSGNAFEGEFQRITGSALVVRRPDGSSMMIPLSRLDSASQALARQLASGGQPATAPAPGGTAAATPAAAAVARPHPEGVPTDAEIAAFKTQWTAPDGKRYLLQAGFGLPSLNESDRRKYARSGKVPYRVTISLYELKEVRGRTLSQRLDGQGNLVILSEAGDVINKERESLGKLCPS